jgi:hypothetical protein
VAYDAKTERLISLKKLSGKAHTSNDKGLANEPLPSGITISTATIFASTITASPSSASPYAITGNVEFLRLPCSFKSGTNTVAGRHGFEIRLPDDYVANSSNSKKGTGNFTNGKLLHDTGGTLQLITPPFATAYEAKPFYGTVGSGTQIALLDARDWNLDYFNGVLFQQDPPGTGDHAQNPTYVEAFLYIGDYLNEHAGLDGDITEVVAGVGLSGGATSGAATVNLDINSLAVDSNAGNLADSMTIADASDSNATKKITLTQLQTLVGGGSGDITEVIAGVGLAGGASSGAATVNLNVDSLPTDSNAGNLADSMTIADASDSNATKKITLTQLKAVVNTDTNTTYTPGDGLDLSGTEFTLDLKSSAGLKIVSSELAVEPTDIAGVGLEDDGSDNLRLNVHGLAADGNAGALADSIAISDVSDSNLTKKITLTQLKARVNTDTNTTYTAGNGLDLSGTEFALDLKSSGGLKIDSAELAVEPNDIAGVGLEDDGSDNLRLNVHGLAADGNAGNLSDSIAIADASDSNLSKKITLTQLQTLVGGGSGDITEVIAGTGLSGGATSGAATVNLDIDGLSVDSNAGNLADSMAIADASDSNLTKKITLTQLKARVNTDTNTTYTAGNGLDLSGTEFALDLKSSAGLKIVSSELAIEPADIAGVGLEDDGSDNLRLNVHSLAADGNAGNLSDSMAIADASDSNLTKKITLTQLKARVNTDTNTTYTAGNGLDLSGTEFALDLKSSSGLKIVSSELAIEPADIAGVGLEDDGSDNLRLNVHGLAADGNAGNLSDSIAIADASDSNLSKKITLTQLQTLVSVGASNAFRTISIGPAGKKVRFTNNFGMGSYGTVPSNIILRFSDGSTNHDFTVDDNSGSSTASATTVGGGTDRSAADVVAEFISEINAGSLNVTATAVSGNTSTDASFTVTPDSGYTVTVTEDPGNNNSGNFGDAAGFTLVTSISGQDDVVADSATDTLTLLGDTGINITTTASADKIAISTAAAQSHVTSLGTLTSLGITGDLTVDTNTLYVKSSTNKVGIGTTSPSVSLEVKAAAHGDGIYLEDDGTATKVVKLKADSAGGVIELRHINNNQNVRLDATGNSWLNGGNVGIGTESPSKKLDVTGDFKVTGTTTLNSIEYTWPASDGSSGQQLQTNGNRTLSWAAAGSVSGDSGGRDKDVYALSQTTALNNISIGSTDLSTVDYDPNSIDVFLNGMLMHSGSATDVAGAAADYYLTGASTLKFAFDVQIDDLLDVVISEGGSPAGAPYITFESHSVLSNERVFRVSSLLSLTTSSPGFIDLDINRKKITQVITTNLVAGNAFSTSYDFSTVSYDPERIDVFVNGILLLSGSSYDYYLQPTNNIIFGFNLFVDDHVTINII